MLASTLRLSLNRLPNSLRLSPTPGRNLVVRPPGSKSLTNRALVLAGLAAGRSVLRNALIDADDAHRMIVAIEQLGARVRKTGHDDLTIDGVGGRWLVPEAGAHLNLKNAGTATRFLTAAAMLASPGSGGVTIDGNARMRERPIGELVVALRQLGATVEYPLHEGYPPVHVSPVPDPGKLADHMVFGRTASSQYVSALMLIAPWLPRGLTVEFDGAVTSASYLTMTIGLLREVGVEVAGMPPDAIRIEPCQDESGEPGLDGFDLDIEPDASGATNFWAAAALSRGVTVRTPGLRFNSLQADARLPMELRKMGASIEYDEGGCQVTGTGRLQGIETDLSLMPDAAMTLASVACFASAPSVLMGLRTLRIKETDRLSAVQTELSKLGVQVEIVQGPADDQGLRIVPPKGGIDCSPAAPPIKFETYDDHRMAMALALIGLIRPNVTILDPQCVAKTYPGFWADLAGLYDHPQ